MPWTWSFNKNIQLNLIVFCMEKSTKSYLLWCTYQVPGHLLRIFLPSIIPFHPHGPIFQISKPRLRARNWLTQALMVCTWWTLFCCLESGMNTNTESKPRKDEYDVFYQLLYWHNFHLPLVMDLNANKGKERAKDYNIRQKGHPFKKSSGIAKSLNKNF